MIFGVLAVAQAAAGAQLPHWQLMVLANLWLFGPPAKAYLSRRPETNAAIRTTTAPTIFEAGVKDNVLPARARAVVNFRLIPGDSISTVLAHVRRVVGDDRIQIRQLGGANPSPVTDVRSPAYALLARTIRQTMPDVVVAPYVLVAATDSRHFTGLTPNVFRFSPMRVARPTWREFTERMSASVSTTWRSWSRSLPASFGTPTSPR